MFSGCALPAPTIPRLIHTLQLSDSALHLAFSADGNPLALAFKDGTIQIWDVNSNSLMNTLEAHTQEVTDLAFSPNGEQLISGSLDKTAKIWQVSDGKLLHTLEGHEDVVSSVAFSTNNEFVATGSWDAKVRVWSADSGKLVTTLDHYPNQVNDVAFSLEGNVLASAAGMSLYLWELPSGKQLGKAEGHEGVVNDVSFSSDGQQIITTGSDNTIRTWQAKDGTAMTTIKSPGLPYQADLNPQNTVLAVNMGGSIQFWQVSNGELLRPLATAGNEAYGFTPDKSKLATSVVNDKTIEIWQMPPIFLNQ
jgi:WD40 repeat protein